MRVCIRRELGTLAALLVWNLSDYLRESVRALLSVLLPHTLRGGEVLGLRLPAGCSARSQTTLHFPKKARSVRKFRLTGTGPDSRTRLDFGAVNYALP
jgi:hypothetical protein